jgi:long-chain fatty acid transport protein
MKKTLLTLSFLFLGISISNSAGFRLADQSASAAAMGNAFVAVANDVSAVWYNPAAIVNLEGTQLSAGSVMIYPLMKHEYSTGSDKAEKKLHIPPHFYATHKYSDKISFGFGVNAPFGLSTDWDKNTATTKSIATYSDIKVIDHNLNAAYKLNDALSFAAGIDFIYLEATLNKMLGAFEQELTGDGNALGWNAAALYKLNKQWTLGTNFRSAVKVDIEDGINKLPGIIYTDAKTSIKLPDIFQIGASYQYNDKWLFSCEADYTDWTTYRQVVIEWNNNTAPSPSIDIKNWKSVWAFRLGTEYKYSDAWKFRGGFFYDNNPIKEKRYDTRMPDSDRIAISFGAGYTKENITIDIVYQYVKFVERTISDSLQDGAGTILNGDYKSTAHLPGITIGYKF